MKQLLLLVGFGLLSTCMWAQDTIYLADFSQGLDGWEVNTISCGGNNFGANLGAYELTSGTLEGFDIIALGDEIRFSFLNENEYAVQYRFVDFEATAYSFYEIENDTLKSSMDVAEMSIGLSFSEQAADGIVDWATYVPNGANLAGVAGVLGANDPMITFANGGMEMTLNIGPTTVLNFEKVNDCGDLWVFSPNGNYGYDIAAFGAALQSGNTIMSDTRTDGVVGINGVYQSSLGNTAYSPGSPPYPQYVAELISPEIDITAADRALELQFTQAIAYLNTPTNAPTTDATGFNGVRSSFAISNDGGATWSLAIDANPTLGPNAIRRNNATVPIPVSTVGDATSIRVKFTLATDFYFWLLDDVVVKERAAYDMQANENFFAIAPNAVTPVSQVTNMGFLADIQNNGGVAADNVNLNLTVTNDDTQEEVYNDDVFYGTIIPDSLAQDVFFGTELPAEAQVQGTYTGVYSVSHDSTDARTNNDTLTFQFVVGDTLFAKETGSTRSVSPADDNSYYYGNIFYTPNGDGMYARYISFAVTNAEEAVNGSGAVTTYLYRWPGNTDPAGSDFVAEPSEYGSPVAFNSYTFDGTEADDDIITIPIDLDGNSFALEDDMYYIAVVQYVSQGEGDDLFMAASEQYDYLATFFYTDSMMVPRYSSALEVGSAAEPEFSTVGFGRDIVPVVRLSIGNNPDITGSPIVDVDDPLPVNYTMNIYPNPARERFTLEVNMPEMADQATVRMFDPAGRILFQREYDNMLEGRFEYEVGNLPAGIYFLQLSTEAGSRTERIVIK